jgi:transcription elongation factor Elf1
MSDRPTCPRCGSPRWVSVSLDEGWTRRAQCVPCGAIHRPVIGPGWQSPGFNDSEAVHPDYRQG